MMLEKGFDHIGLAGTGPHWTSQPYEDKIPQRFRGHFIRQQIDSTTSYNRHDTLSGPYQYGGTLSLSTGSFTGWRIERGKYFSGLGRWSWQQLRGKWEASLQIAGLYISVPPDTGGGAGSVYSQHLTHLHNINRLQCPRVAIIKDLVREIE